MRWEARRINGVLRESSSEVVHEVRMEESGLCIRL